MSPVLAIQQESSRRNLSNDNIEVKSGLIAHFGFDGGQLKEERQSRYAAGKNSPGKATDRFGRSQQALWLDGNDDYIDLSSGQFSYLDIARDLTITAWVYLEDKGFIIIDNRSEWQYYEQGYHLQVNDSGQLVFMASDEKENYCENKFVTKERNCSVYSKGSGIEKNKWQHVAVSKVGRNITFYINGQRRDPNQNLKTDDILYNYERDKRYIGTGDDSETYSGGAYYTGSDRYSKGRLDDLRIYNRQLSDSEITKIYNYKPPHPCNLTKPESTDCLSCRGNRDLNGLQCDCPSGHYEDNTSENCPVCGDSCKTCENNRNNCIECKDPNKKNESGSCINCKDGYYNDGSTTCAKCDNQCSSCSGSANSCIQCSDSNRIKAEGCRCQDGFIDIGNPICANCSWQCQNCFDQRDKCSSCSDVNRIDDEQCNCKKGYYGLDNQAECLQCKRVCDSCENGQECLTCAISDPPRQGKQCYCPDRYFDDGENNQCQKCDSGCETCDKKGMCSRCKTSIPLRIGDKCECSMFGYYDDLVSDDCQRCHFRCGFCSENADKCNQCANDTRDPSKDCQCKEGYWEKNVPICQNGCTNYPGTYDNGNQECISCSPICQNCQGNSTNCTQCYTIGNNRKNDPPSCGCKDGFYENDQKECVICNSKCSTCDNNGKCSSCSNSSYSPPQCETDKDGFYSVNPLTNQIEFKQCDVQCIKCVEKTDNCLGCKIEPNRDSNPPLCSCKDEYYHDIKTGFCLKCSPLCLTCSTFNICTECPKNQNRVLNQFKGSCVCQIGFTENQGQCVKCHNYKGQCLIQCPNTTVQKGDQCIDTDPGVTQNMKLMYIAAISFVFLQVLLCLILKKLIQKKQLKKISKLQSGKDANLYKKDDCYDNQQNISEQDQSSNNNNNNSHRSKEGWIANQNHSEVIEQQSVQELEDQLNDILQSSDNAKNEEDFDIIEIDA